jgi:hypothetical protein
MGELNGKSLLSVALLADFDSKFLGQGCCLFTAV